MPMRRTRRTLAILAFTLVSCSSPVVPASTPTTNTVALRIYATTATIPLMRDLSERYASTHPGVTFDTITGNFQTLYDQLMRDKQGYLLTSHLPNSQPDGTPLAWPVGQDGIAIIVYPDNPITELSSDQLRRIYLGHISKWSEIGGEDTDIIVFSREDGSGTRAEFERLLMGERLTTQSAQLAPSSQAMVTGVAASPGSIGYVSMSYLNETIRGLAIDGVMPTPDTVYDNTYPLRSTMFIVGLEEPKDAYREFIGWVQGTEGQEIIAQRYAPLLRP